jgi:uncharacterized protein (TIGR00369 family)
MALEVRDPAFRERILDSFGRQRMMSYLGARIIHMTPGEIDIELPFRMELTQQHGFVHAGAITSIADSACGYAASTLMPADASVLTVEFKVNLLAPAQGQRFVARGRVLRAGRTLTVCTSDVVAHDGNHEQIVAAMQGTIMTLPGRPGREA